MRKNNGPNIFSNAIQDLRKNKQTTSKKGTNYEVRGMVVDDMIDFDEESEKLGDDLEIETFSNKIKSAVIKTSSTPYPISLNAATSRHHNKTNIKIVKSENNTQILLNPKNAHQFNLKKNNDGGIWKHDLFDGISTKKHILFIRNLSALMPENKLKDIFIQFGHIVSVKIDRGTAEVVYSRKEYAITAVENTNGMELFGKAIKTTYYEEDNGNESTDRKRSNSKKTIKELNNGVRQISLEKRESIWDRIKLNN
jgi:RNA recognition motif-containing protein